MQKIGLTGSISVGKTTVCNILLGLGCHVLDSDQTARDVVEIGTPGLKAIVENFGKDVILPSGALNRAKLGSIVFGNREKLDLLNSIVHPLVFATQEQWLADVEYRDKNGIAIIDAALMIESGNYKRFAKLIVVWCKPDIQMQRLMKRDNLSSEDAQKRIASQMSQDAKKSFADYLIDTSDGFEEAERQTKEIVAILHQNKHPHP